MKKMIPLFLVLTMVVGLLAGCGKKNAAETGESDSNKLSVVTTIFPEYDWVKEILGDKAESTDLTMLLDNGVDLHLSLIHILQMMTPPRHQPRGSGRIRSSFR